MPDDEHTGLETQVDMQERKREKRHLPETEIEERMSTQHKRESDTTIPIINSKTKKNTSGLRPETELRAPHTHTHTD